MVNAMQNVTKLNLGVDVAAVEAPARRRLGPVAHLRKGPYRHALSHTTITQLLHTFPYHKEKAGPQPENRPPRTVGPLSHHSSREFASQCLQVAATLGGRATQVPYKIIIQCILYILHG